MKSIPDKQTLYGEYSLKFIALAPSTLRIAEIDATIGKILANQKRYEAVANKLPNPPWYVIALIHMREADLDFTCHLHNGDPLHRRTVHVPAGRPPGPPPFTWEESAWDALKLDRLDKMPYTSVAEICYALESYNGWGYRSHNTPSPYLWSASNQYSAGKFVQDGVFSATQSDAQLGAITVLKRMIDTHELSLPATEVRAAA